METLDLHAATRISRPPEVSRAQPYNTTDKKTKKVTKPTQKPKKQITIPPSPTAMETTQPMNIETTTTQPNLLVQSFAPTLNHSVLPKSSKSTIRNNKPLSSKISCDVNEILERKADL